MPTKELLSVYRDYGVVPKSSRDDNFNKPSEDLSSYRYVRPGDLVLNKMKTWQGSLGISSHEGIVSPAYFVCEVSPDIHPRYAHYLLRSAPYIHLYRSVSKGIRPNQWDLPYDEMASLPALLPPLEDQRRIADFLDAETSRIDQLLALRTRQRELADERILGVIRHLAIGGSAATEPSGNLWIPKVPPKWQVLSLRRRWRIVDCKHRTPSYVPTGYPVVSPGDISAGRLDLSRCHRFVDLEDYEDLADDLRRARRGDIVYSRNASVGTASYVDTDEPFTMGQDVCRITSDRQDQLYLAYVLNVVVKPQLNSLQVGSTFTRVNIGTLLGLAVPCPPPEVQRSIAREMDSVTNKGDLLKRALDRQMALLGKRRQALITAAVTGQVDVTTASGRNTTQGV
ncbi:restriction endonuclease subunit S [Nocardia cyriacigeorgica]|uniref:restriction endonuclease subunit S n=1 Tax=Nocardia cyriacigeorgica TaxID=135487 RepID=UPI00245569DA|nr:restriction endonuclease subunit S [Nocardia cyriacigeorgica]